MWHIFYTSLFTRTIQSKYNSYELFLIDFLLWDHMQVLTLLCLAMWSMTCIMSHGTGLNYVLILFCSSFYTNFLPIFILILFSLVVFNYFIWVDNILFSQVGLIPDCYCTLYWGPGTSQGTTLNPLIHNNLLTLRPAQWRHSDMVSF